MIPHWLTKQAYLAPHRPAIEMESGDVITFHQLKEQSQRLARQLATVGVKTGDHVGLLFTNHPSMVVTIHALSYLGAVCVLLNHRLTKAELLYQLEDADISLLIIGDDLQSQGKELTFSGEILTYDAITEVMEKQNVDLKGEIHLDDPFTIIYTSGTTGYPKGVVHTYGNHWWSAISSALNLGLHQDDKWLATLPLFHVSGLSILMKSVIYGMPILLLDHFDPSRFNNVINERGVTIASVVTVMLQQCLQALGENHYPDHFRCMLIGGGPVPTSLLEKAQARHIPVFQSYGLTESSSQIVTLSPEDALTKIGSAGKPLFPAQITIHQPAPDGVGEIFIKGPMVTKGYYQKEEITQQQFVDGWFKTGDLGYVDEAGYLYVVDRRTDLIISGGENIYPAEIENVLLKLDGIQDVGVVGVDDPQWGQVPIACIVKNDQALTAEEIIAFANQQLARYKLPKKVYFFDELPRNAAKKLMRHKLIDMLKQ